MKVMALEVITYIEIYTCTCTSVSWEVIIELLQEYIFGTSVKHFLKHISLFTHY